MFVTLFSATQAKEDNRLLDSLGDIIVVVEEHEKGTAASEQQDRDTSLTGLPKKETMDACIQVKEPNHHADAATSVSDMDAYIKSSPQATDTTETGTSMEPKMLRERKKRRSGKKAGQEAEHNESYPSPVPLEQERGKVEDDEGQDMPSPGDGREPSLMAAVRLTEDTDNDHELDAVDTLIQERLQYRAKIESQSKDVTGGEQTRRDDADSPAPPDSLQDDTLIQPKNETVEAGMESKSEETNDTALESSPTDDAVQIQESVSGPAVLDVAELNTGYDAIIEPASAESPPSVETAHEKCVTESPTAVAVEHVLKADLIGSRVADINTDCSHSKMSSMPDSEENNSRLDVLGLDASGSADALQEDRNVAEVWEAEYVEQRLGGIDSTGGSSKKEQLNLERDEADIPEEGKDQLADNEEDNMSMIAKLEENPPDPVSAVEGVEGTILAFPMSPVVLIQGVVNLLRRTSTEESKNLEVLNLSGDSQITLPGAQADTRFDVPHEPAGMIGDENVFEHKAHIKVNTFGTQESVEQKFENVKENLYSTNPNSPRVLTTSAEEQTGEMKYEPIAEQLSLMTEIAHSNGPAALEVKAPDMKGKTPTDEEIIMAEKETEETTKISQTMPESQIDTGLNVTRELSVGQESVMDEQSPATAMNDTERAMEADLTVGEASTEVEVDSDVTIAHATVNSESQEEILKETNVVYSEEAGLEREEAEVNVALHTRADTIQAKAQGSPVSNLKDTRTTMQETKDDRVEEDSGPSRYSLDIESQVALETTSELPAAEILQQPKQQMAATDVTKDDIQSDDNGKVDVTEVANLEQRNLKITEEVQHPESLIHETITIELPVLQSSVQHGSDVADKEQETEIPSFANVTDTQTDETSASSEVSSKVIPERPDDGDNNGTMHISTDTGGSNKLAVLDLPNQEVADQSEDSLTNKETFVVRDAMGNGTGAVETGLETNQPSEIEATAMDQTDERGNDVLIIVEDNRASIEMQDEEMTKPAPTTQEMEGLNRDMPHKEELAPSVSKEELALSVSTEELAPSVSKEELAPSVSKEELAPSVSKGELAPSVSTEELAPSVSMEELAPSVSKEELAPSVSKEELVPSVSKEELAPSVSKEELAPSVSKEDLATSVSKEELVPSVSKEELAPSVSKEELAPSVSKEELAPSVSKEELAPSVSKEELAPSVSKEDLATSVSKEELAPSVSKEELAPSVSKEELAPSVSKEELAPSVSKEELAPSVSKEELAPSVSKEELAPSVSKEDLATSVSKEELAPSVSKEELAPSVSKEELATSVSKEELATSVSKEELAPSVSKEELAPSVSKEELAPSVSKEQLAPSVSKEDLATSMSKEEQCTEKIMDGKKETTAPENKNESALSIQTKHESEQSRRTVLDGASRPDILVSTVDGNAKEREIMAGDATDQTPDVCMDHIADQQHHQTGSQLQQTLQVV